MRCISTGKQKIKKTEGLGEFVRNESRERQPTTTSVPACAPDSATHFSQIVYTVHRDGVVKNAILWHSWPKSAAATAGTVPFLLRPSTSAQESQLAILKIGRLYKITTSCSIFIIQHGPNRFRLMGANATGLLIRFC